MLKSRCKVAFAAIWAEKWQKSSNNKSMLIRPRFRLFLSRHLPIMHTDGFQSAQQFENLPQTDWQSDRLRYRQTRPHLTSKRQVFFRSRRACARHHLVHVPSRLISFSWKSAMGGGGEERGKTFNWKQKVLLLSQTLPHIGLGKSILL